jgi:hypothetical protein
MRHVGLLLLALFLLSWISPASSQVRPSLATTVAQLLGQAVPAPPLREMDEALAVKARWLSDSDDSDTPEPGPEAPAKVFIPEQIQVL